MQKNFTYNGEYNSKPTWVGIINSITCSIKWNLSGYWEIEGWPYGGNVRSYTTDYIPLTGWVISDTTQTGTVTITSGLCIESFRLLQENGAYIFDESNNNLNY